MKNKNSPPPTRTQLSSSNYNVNVNYFIDPFSIPNKTMPTITNIGTSSFIPNMNTINNGVKQEYTYCNCHICNKLINLNQEDFYDLAYNCPNDYHHCDVLYFHKICFEEAAGKDFTMKCKDCVEEEAEKASTIKKEEIK